MEKLEIKVQLLNLDRVENNSPDKRMDSKREASKRMANPGEDSMRRRTNNSVVLVKGHKSISMKNMLSDEGQKGFVGLNEVDLSSQKKTHRQHQLSTDMQGLRMSYAKSQGVGYNSDIPSPFAPVGQQEVKRFSSSFKKSEQEVSDSTPSKKENITKKSIVTRQDEDWDNDMFGSGTNQLSPLKPKNQEEHSKQSSGTKYSFNDKKNQLSQKRTEFVASRQGTHNDWDDDL